MLHIYLVAKGRKKKEEAHGFALATFIVGGLVGGTIAYMGRAEIDRLLTSFKSGQGRVLYAGKYVYR